MTQADFDTFSYRLGAVAGIFGRRLPEDTVAVYFRVLGDLDLSAVLQALERFARTADTGARFPSPRDLRTLASETASPTRRPTDAELGRILTATNIALASWERDDGIGSARPTFDRAWREACERERVLPSATDRERCWQAYLQAGNEPRAGLAQRLLADALRREAARRGEPPRISLFANVVQHIRREPGEEG